MKTLFNDSNGVNSSFRVIWSISTLIIVITWAIANIKIPNSMNWPFDGITTIGWFSAPGIKTASEKMNNINKKE